MRETQPGLAGENIIPIDDKFRNDPIPESTAGLNLVYKELRGRDHNKYAEHMPVEQDSRAMYLLWLQMWATAKYHVPPEDQSKLHNLLGADQKYFRIPHSWLDENILLKDMIKARGDENSKLLPQYTTLPKHYRAILSHHPSIKVAEELLLHHDLSDNDISNLLASTFSVHGIDKYNELFNQIKTKRGANVDFTTRLDHANYRLNSSIRMLNEPLKLINRTEEDSEQRRNMNPEAYKPRPNYGPMKNLVVAYEDTSKIILANLPRYFSLQSYNFTKLPPGTERNVRKMNATLMVGIAIAASADLVDIFDNTTSDPLLTIGNFLRLAIPLGIHLASVAATQPPNITKEIQELGGWNFNFKIPY